MRRTISGLVNKKISLSKTGSSLSPSRPLANLIIHNPRKTNVKKLNQERTMKSSVDLIRNIGGQEQPSTIVYYRTNECPHVGRIGLTKEKTKSGWQWRAINNGVIKENTIRSLLGLLFRRLFGPGYYSNILTSISIYSRPLALITCHTRPVDIAQCMKYLFNLFKFLRVLSWHR